MVIFLTFKLKHFVKIAQQNFKKLDAQKVFDFLKISFEKSLKPVFLSFYQSHLAFLFIFEIRCQLRTSSTPKS